MTRLIYDPIVSGKRMTIVCFISGSGTNYREIVKANRNHEYIVFTNRPGCNGTDIARENKHDIIELSHLPYLKDAREKYGSGNIPRNCPERINYEKEVCRLLENRIGRKPDLMCLTGYDQWLTDWMVEKYYPRILNVHPGDTTKSYDGLHWIPSAKAILAGDESIRSTLFIVDKGEDTGPVLIQSRPLSIVQVLTESGLSGIEGLATVMNFARTHSIGTYEEYQKKAGIELVETMEHLCRKLQDMLKVRGDWEIYPFAVNMVAQGKVGLEGRTVFVDGKELPRHGYRMDEYTI
jgi:folate-dependent phosphoribosylglycinamide formyltransferase PurN